MAKPVTIECLLRIMREHPAEFQQKITSGISAQLSLPGDGKGLRVKVSVPFGWGPKIPRQTTFALNGEEYIIPLEVVEDYQQYIPL